MKTNWSSKLLSTTRHPIGYALEGVLSGLEARVALNPLRVGHGAARPQGNAQLGRLREVLDRDRALVAAGAPLPSPLCSSADPRASTPQVPPLAIAPGPVAAPRAQAPAGAFATPEPSPPASAARVVQEAAPTPATEGADEEPIRTRTMARLLAAQGHRVRALAIYGALMATDPDPDLRAEAERLRARES